LASASLRSQKKQSRRAFTRERDFFFE
jgi:hypothetical protein